MAYWLLKTEPDTFSWADQVQKGDDGEPWSGVRNHQAKNNLMQMKRGERAFFYHTGEEKRIVGVVEVVREHYPDPTDASHRFVAVDLKALGPLPVPITLEAIKAERRLKAMVLVNNTRLSVQPVTDREWGIVLKMAGVSGWL